MQVNMVSALLKRLVEKGAVTQVDRKGRVHYYQVTERLYNIYHLMRLSGSAGDRVKALVRCMVPLYGEAAIACALAKETCHVDGELRSWFIKGYGSILEQTRQQADMLRSILENTPQAFFELPEAKYLKPLMGKGVPHEDSTSESALLIEKSADLIRQGKFTEGIDVFDEMVERFGQSEDVRLLVLVALALVSKGLALGAMGKPEEAVSAYDSVVERFGQSEDGRLLEPVAMAFVSKGNALGAMGKPEEAVAAYESVVERFGQSEDARLLGPVAVAHNGKAWIICQQKDILRLHAAIHAAENATRLSPNDNRFRHTLASAYGLAGRWPEAFEQAAIFADDPELIENCPDEILDFFIKAAAAGEAEAALRTIRKTAAAASLEPLVAALGILTGADFHAPREVMEVASDIVRKIGSPGGTQSVR
jgi:tetratricopeptide (TPR) repeat protein